MKKQFAAEKGELEAQRQGLEEQMKKLQASNHPDCVSREDHEAAVQQVFEKGHIIGSLEAAQKLTATQLSLEGRLIQEDQLSRFPNLPDGYDLTRPSPSFHTGMGYGLHGD